ncbi:MAG TPA: deaminase [Terriglobales bacterium]|nr:deaminase [Terriglobales bacterium]
MVIGLTGTNGSGKTTLAEHLQAAGFYYLSLSDEIRAELEQAGLPPTRENLIARGNALRRDHGRDVLAVRTRARLLPERNYVVDSIRHPDEVRALRALPDFHLLHLEAPLELRYQRARQRGDARAPASFEQFVNLERREVAGIDPEAQNLPACAEMADAVLVNDGDLAELTQRAEAIIQGWLRQNAQVDPRPGWDEYFMRIARIVALRSNCLKRKVAAIIVRDRRIISTGYNGTPRGVANCNQGGCPRCSNLAASGTRLDECVCSHGEENAIVQAAYHGIAIKDGVLYTTLSPCLQCTKMIINAGITEVVFNAHYPLNQTSLRILEEAGVRLRQIELGD